jgi:3-methyladenine DNA glycosylase AlkD
MMVIVPKIAVTPLATEVVDRLKGVYAAAADPVKASAMRAYMRDQFPFLGIPAPLQVRLNREVMAGIGKPDEADLGAIAFACWELDSREYQYFACKLLRKHRRTLSSAFLPTTAELIASKSWWDTVDELAAHVVGAIVHADRLQATVMDDWSTDEDLWLVRTAILHQLNYREDTDATRLFHYCSVQAQRPEFFVRKAIGWALRVYSKTDPVAVRDFVKAHQARLSGLSSREALRLIPVS